MTVAIAASFNIFGPPTKEGITVGYISTDRGMVEGVTICEANAYAKLNPGTKTIPHTHSGHEEFLILDGELIDSDGTIFKKGDFISYEPGSSHSSYTKNGCLILTFMRGHNHQIKN